jgi:hypothetical protein
MKKIFVCLILVETAQSTLPRLNEFTQRLKWTVPPQRDPRVMNALLSHAVGFALNKEKEMDHLTAAIRLAIHHRVSHPELEQIFIKAQQALVKDEDEAIFESLVRQVSPFASKAPSSESVEHLSWMMWDFAQKKRFGTLRDHFVFLEAMQVSLDVLAKIFSKLNYLGSPPPKYAPVALMDLSAFIGKYCTPTIEDTPKSLFFGAIFEHQARTGRIVNILRAAVVGELAQVSESKLRGVFANACGILCSEQKPVTTTDWFE